MTEEQQIILKAVKGFFDKLTDEERGEFISELLEDYCSECMMYDPKGRCQCWNDE